MKITWAEYDDGGAERKGKVIDTRGAKLRLRYLSDYNFMICAKESPFNSSQFDLESDGYFDRIIKGQELREHFMT
jgi:hypothetical protein